jgi:hypothetical protein
VGATEAVAIIGADRSACALTATAALCTGFALANASRCTAITAPGAARFT